MKLLDFTGRKVDPSLLLGDMKTKKDKDPNIKVGYIAFSMGVLYILSVPAGVQSIQALRLRGAPHSQEEKEGN